MGLLGGDILYWENNNKEYNLNAHWEKINNNNKNTTFLTGYLKKKKTKACVWVKLSTLD